MERGVVITNQPDLYDSMCSQRRALPKTSKDQEHAVCMHNDCKINRSTVKEASKSSLKALCFVSTLRSSWFSLGLKLVLSLVGCAFGRPPSTYRGEQK